MRTTLSFVLAALALVLASGIAEAGRLRGKVTWRDDDGSTRAPAFGTVEFWSRKHGEWTKHEAALSAGAFEVEIAEPFAWLDAGPLRLEGREAHAAWGADGTLPAEPIELVARWTHPVALRVVGAASGIDLERVELVADDAKFHPSNEGGSHTRLGEALASPIALPLWHDGGWSKGFVGRRAYWARAPGYAWQRIEVDAATRAENVLRLVPNADLLLEIAAPPLPADVRVLVANPRVEHESLRVPFSATKGREHVVESLAPGSYRVLAQLVNADGFDTDALLFDRTIELRAGEVGNVRIELVERTRAFDRHGNVLAGTAPLRGTLRVPLAWKERVFSLRFERYELATRGYRRAFELSSKSLVERPSEPGTFDWDAGLVRPGAWLAVLAPVPWSATFPLEGAGPFTIALELPPPADVRVRLVDATTKKDVDAQLAWYALPPPQPSGIVGAGVARDAASASFVFQAPVGEIVLMPMRSDYPMRFERVPIAAGVNEIVLTLAKPRRIFVTMREGERSIDLDECIPRVVPLDGAGKNVGFSTADDFGKPRRTIVMVDAAGRYRVELEPSSVFELVEAREVDLREVETVEIELVVRRRG